MIEAISPVAKEILHAASEHLDSLPSNESSSIERARIIQSLPHEVGPVIDQNDVRLLFDLIDNAKKAEVGLEVASGTGDVGLIPQTPIEVYSYLPVGKDQAK